MTVLVTGGGGFIGSHLVDHLLADTTEDIRVLDNFSTGEPENLKHIDMERVTIARSDIRDAETVIDAATDVDAIYHLAAAVGVQRIVDEPLESLRTNLTGTEHVLEAARKADASVFIASSSEVYGKSEAVPFAEDDDRVLGPTTVPRWGYASAKAVDEFLGLAYSDEYGIPVVIGRYFNVVGPRQTGEYGMVIPRFVEQALDGRYLTVYGDGTQKRSFTHVADAVKATRELLTGSTTEGDVYNIGSPNPITINELAEKVLAKTGSNSELTHTPLEEVYGPDFEEPDQREPDISKLEATLGWAPQMDIERILIDVIMEKREERR